jgi:hypothetical protein
MVRAGWRSTGESALGGVDEVMLQKVVYANKSSNNTSDCTYPVLYSFCATPKTGLHFLVSGLTIGFHIWPK